MTPHPDGDDPRLTELLLRWEELRDQGRTVTPVELCSTCPELAEELARRIAMLRRFDPIGDDPASTDGKSSSPEVAGVGGRRSASASAEFRDLHFHASGALGEVYMARNAELNRDVALKFLRPEQASHPDSRRRFLQEAEITGRLEHPGVVPIYALGTDPDGSPCYAMRFIRGETLQDAIDAFHSAEKPGRDPSERSLALRELLSRFISICNTIGYAHSRGILHRDLKPRNVMLGKYGETLVVDWGLAKPFDRDEAAREIGEETLMPGALSGGDGSDTPTVGVVGTPAYMSPEQAEARSDLVGPASDLFGLGAILYAILAGQPPYQGRKVGEVLEKAKRCKPPAPRQVRPKVSRSLEAICLKAMARRPEDRYGSALELAADVRRWLADEPVAAYAEPLSARARRWMRRHRTLVTTLAATLVVATISLGIALSLMSGINRRLDAAGREVSETNRLLGESNARLVREAEALEREKDRADQGERAARWNLYATRIRLIQGYLAAGRIESARELLDELRPAPGRPDLRDFEWYYLWRLCHADRSVLLPGIGQILALAISPDGRTLAASGSEKALVLWDLASRRPRRTIRGLEDSVTSLTFARGGRALVTVPASANLKPVRVQVRDAETGEVTATADQARPVTMAVATPDGETIALARADGPVTFCDAATLRELRSFRVHRDMVAPLAFSPDGATAASVEGFGRSVKLWESATGKALALLDGYPGQVGSARFTPDGRTLVAAGTGSGGDRGGGEVWLWDLATNRLRERLRGHENSISGLDLSPDGKALATASGDGTARLWDLAVGRCWSILRGHTGNINGVAFAPDGRSVATGGVDGTIRLWDATRRHAGRVVAAALSTDGKAAAAAQEDGTLLIWDVDAASVRHTLAPHAGPIAALAFAPDGRTLVTAGTDGDVAIWDPASARELARFDAAAGSITALAFDPAGALLAVAGRNRVVTLWDAATRQRRGTLAEHPRAVSSLAFRPDGKALAAGVEEGDVLLWDVPESRVIRSLPGGGGKVLALAWGEGAKIVAAGGEDGRVRGWEAATGRPAGLRAISAGALSAGAFVVTAAGPRLALGDEEGVVRLPVDGDGDGLVHAHSGIVTALSYSDGGRVLLSAGDDGAVKLWSPDGRLVKALPGGPLIRNEARGSRLRDGRRHETLQTDHGYVWSLDFSRDGRTLVAASGEQFALDQPGRASLWDVGTGARKSVFQPRGARVTALAYLQGGRTLAAADAAGVVTLRDAATGREVADLRAHPAGYPVMAANPDGSTPITAGGATDASAAIKLWDPATARAIRTLSGHAAGVTALALSPDDKTLASGSGDRTVRLWDVALGREIAKLQGHSAGILALAFSPDGKALASGDGDPAHPEAPATIRLWDLETRRERATLEGHTAGVRGLRFSPDGRTLASGGWDGVVHLWEMPAGTLRATLSPPPPAQGRKPRAFALAFAPDGSTLAVAMEDEAVHLWDPATGRELGRLEGHRGPVLALAFAPDGKALASAGQDAAVVLWDVAAREERVVIPGAVGPGRAAALSADGTMLAARFSGGGAIGRRYEGATLLWDLADGRQRAVIQGDIRALGAWSVEAGRHIALSPDGSTLAMPAQTRPARPGATPEMAIDLWETATGRRRARLATGNVTSSSLAFSPDGRILAVGDWDGAVSLWDVPGGTKRATTRGHNQPVWSIAFSPDGRALATGAASRDATIKFWDIGQGPDRPLVERGGFRGHLADIWSLAFAPSGRILASAGGDGTVKIIDVATIQERASFVGEGAHMTSVAFSPDGKTIAAGAYNLIQFWDAAGDDEVDAPE